MVVVWLDKNVSDFLDHFTNITNNLACIVRRFAGLEYLRVLTAVTVIIGVHLVEPYLSLTTSSSTTWETLVEAFPTLYTDLTTTKAKLLLDLTSPAFKFISEDKFKQCLYPAHILQPTVEIIETYREDVLLSLRILLPMLAEGWKLQRGDMFDFGESSGESSMKINNYDQDKLKTAPVHNIDSERAVGSVNYGLSVRGSKQIKAVSSSLVKARAASLIKEKQVSKVFRKMVQTGGEIPEILAKWETEQQKLKEKGMEAKEIANISVDKQRNADLASLTALGGPFTKPEQVDQFIKEDKESDSVKNKRMYLKVSYGCKVYLQCTPIATYFP